MSDPQPESPRRGSTLTAFPADGFTARWQRWDGSGDETLTLRWENEGWTALGEVGLERITYVMRLSPLWKVRQLLVFRDLDEPDLWLGTDGAGRWGEVNGTHRADLDGCVDVDLVCTPFANTLPIRRHALQIGDGIELKVARVDVETLGVTPVIRRYRRIGNRRWSVADRNAPSPNDATATATEFDVDEYGLAQDIAATFRRH